MSAAPSAPESPRAGAGSGNGNSSTSGSGATVVLPEGAQRVADWLRAHGHAEAPRLLDGAARTAQQAACALGVALGQIAKSIVFRRLADDAAVLVVAAGDRRVDEAVVAARVGPIGRADAAFVKARTGFAIGGVAPVAHAEPPVALLDDSLRRFDALWAAAGHPHAVFALTPDALQRLTGAEWATLAQSPAAAAPGA